MKNIARRASVATIALLSVGLLAGCGSKVPKDDVESQISSAISKAGGSASDVSCPDDLKGEVGAEMTCSLKLNGKKQDVKVKVTKVEDGKAYFNVLPADSK